MSKKPEVTESPLFTVAAKQYVSLVFPKSVPSFGGGLGYCNFTKNLSADEARALAAALKKASAELD